MCLFSPDEVMQSQTNGGGKQVSAGAQKNVEEEEEEDADVQDKRPSVRAIYTYVLLIQKYIRTKT